MKAVIYARYSSDNQREESIEGQLRECMFFAERKGYTVIKSYADRAISGKRADNRPEFQQMISDSAKGEFDVIIVWKIDRFSRDKYDSVIYKSKLSRNGVSVISATEPIDNSPEGKLMESIFEGFSEYYVKDLELKTSRGMTENAIKGKFNGGSVTFGYIIGEDKQFRTDPVNASIVTDIFTRYADGEPIRSIVDDLNSKGIKNKGREFTYHFINWLLKNRRYLGEYTFRDTVNTTAIPPLVSAEVFERCQQRLNDNKHKPASFRVTAEKFLLTGKLFCGCCGDTISGISGTSKKQERYRYYQCMSSKKKACTKKNAGKDFIENIVFDLTMDIFYDKALIKRICDTCYEMQNTKSPQLAALKKQLKQNKKEIDNVMNAVKAGLITKSTKAALEALEQEQEKLEIAIAQEQIARPVLSREQIEFWIMQFAKTDFRSTEQKQRLIDIFVNSITLWDDKLVVIFNFRDGEKCIRFDDVEMDIKKANTQEIECSSLIKSGDPYGN
ncbi:MAG: recombinase family protein [Oscillospiraceae bacterium]